MEDYEELRQQIEDELGADVYHIHTEGRYFPAEALIGHFILTLVMAYVTELSGVKELAKRHRERLAGFISRVRGGDHAPAPAEAAEMREELRGLLADAPAEDSADASEALRTIFAEEMGMPPEKASKYADRVGEMILSYVRKSKAA